MRALVRRVVIGAVVVVMTVVSLATAAQAASTPITPGTPVHLKLGVNATQSFTIPMQAHQTLAMITTNGTANADYQLYGPGNANVGEGSLGAPNNTAFDYNNLGPGTYTLTFSSTTTPVEFDLDVRTLSIATSALQPGSTVTQQFATPWQNIERTFHADAGQHIGFELGAPSITNSVDSNGARASIDVRIAAPGTEPYQGTSLNDITQNDAAGFEEFGIAPVSGTYTLLFDPWKDATGSISLNAVVTSDIVRTASLGKTQTMDTTAPAQNQIVRFKGAVGYRPILRVSKVSLISVSQHTPPDLDNQPVYWLRDPNGTVVEQFHQEVQLRDTYLAFGKAGVWSVMLDPQHDYIGHIEYTLTLVKDLAYTPKAGAKLKLAIAEPGQNATIGVDLTKGQRLVVIHSAAHWTGQPSFGLIGPDLLPVAIYGAKKYLESVPVAKTGRYYLSIDPPDTGTGSETFMWYVGKTVIRTIPIGTHFVVTTTQEGENDRLKFSGTSGKRFSLRVFSQSWTSIASLNSATIELLDPAGRTFWSTEVPKGASTITGPVLNSTGTWSLVIDPDRDTIGTITATPYLT